MSGKAGYFQPNNEHPFQSGYKSIDKNNNNKKM